MVAGTTVVVVVVGVELPLLSACHEAKCLKNSTSCRSSTAVAVSIIANTRLRRLAQVEREMRAAR